MYAYSYNERDYRATITSKEKKIGVALENIGPHTSEFLRELVEEANQAKEKDVSEREGGAEGRHRFHDYLVHGAYHRFVDADDTRKVTSTK